jgi:hypothetical protein
MIWRKANTTFMSGHRSREHESASIRYGTFDQYLESQQQYAWPFHHTLCSVKFQDLVDAIKEEPDIAISDGSHKNKWGTASWRIMSDTNESEQWTGLHATPGRKDDQSVFRSELGGTYAIWKLQFNSYASSSIYPMDQCPLEVTVKRLCITYFIRTKKKQQQHIILI